MNYGKLDIKKYTPKEELEKIKAYSRRCHKQKMVNQNMVRFVEISAAGLAVVSLLGENLV